MGGKGGAPPTWPGGGKGGMPVKLIYKREAKGREDEIDVPPGGKGGMPGGPMPGGGKGGPPGGIIPGGGGKGGRPVRSYVRKIF